MKIKKLMIASLFLMNSDSFGSKDLPKEALEGLGEPNVFDTPRVPVKRMPSLDLRLMATAGETGSDDETMGVTDRPKRHRRKTTVGSAAELLRANPWMRDMEVAAANFRARDAAELEVARALAEMDLMSDEEGDKK